MAYTFHFLDDVALADLAFEASGDSLLDLFQGATNAVIETFADPETIRATWQQTIERTEGDPAALLFDWLSDLVYWKDAAGVVFHKVELKLSQEDDRQWIVKGMLFGSPVNGSVQTLRNDVKGVTKHLYQLIQEGDRWTVRVVLDV